MTYQPLTEWISLDDLLSLERGKRIAYVRKNLAAKRDGRAPEHLTLDEFAAAVGAKNRQRPIGWEKGETPRDYAERIAALTPYPPAAFGAPEEAELVRQTYGRRLEQLEARVAQLVTRDDLVEATEKLRTQLLRSQANSDTPETQRPRAARRKGSAN